MSTTFPQAEIDALYSLYNATRGYDWEWDSDGGAVWNFTSVYNPCLQEWQGVFCDQSNSTIIALKLLYHDLTGKLPCGLINLTHAEALDFSYNALSGTIPTCLFTLPQLQFFEVGYNYLTGSIPSQAYEYSANTLIGLFMDENQLTGWVPDSICDMKRLTYWTSIDNQFSGPLPNCIGQLGKLPVYLSLTDNFFSRTIPSSFVNLTSLPALSLDSNMFTGPVPLSFQNLSTYYISINLNNNLLSGSMDWLPLQNLTSLVLFDFSGNWFSSSLPKTAFQACPKLHSILAANNLLSGSLPCSIVNTQLHFWDIAYNYFTGSLPSCYECLALTKITMQQNLFSGPLLESFNWTRMDELVQLSAFDNLITGVIPNSLFQLLTLESVMLQFNFLTGTIFSGAGQLPKLSSLLLQGNRLHGSLSQLFVNHSFPALEQLDLSNNAFTGTLPSAFFSSSKTLQNLALAANCLDGSLPESLCSVRTLKQVSLDGLATGFTCRAYIWTGGSSEQSLFGSFVLQKTVGGMIPECYYSLPQLQLLHLSGNALSGSLPSNVSFGSQLVNISLSHNRLTGTIPVVFLDRFWESFDLSYNKLHGTITAVDTLGYGYEEEDEDEEENTSNNERSGNWTASDSASPMPFNDSLVLLVNRLSGPIPSRVRDLSIVSILDGNMFSCSLGRKSLPPNDPVSDTYSCGSNATNWIVYVFVILALVVPSSIGVLAWWRRKKNFKKRNQELNRAYCHEESQSQERTITTTKTLVSTDIIFDQNVSNSNENAILHHNSNEEHNVVSSCSHDNMLSSTTNGIIQLRSRELGVSVDSQIAADRIFSLSSDVASDSRDKRHSTSSRRALLVRPAWIVYEQWLWMYETLRALTVVQWLWRVWFEHLARKWAVVVQYLEEQQNSNTGINIDSTIPVDDVKRAREVLELYLQNFFDMLSLLWRCLCWVVCVLLPVFAVSKLFFKTYTFQYIWQLSSTLMHGRVAAALLTICFVSTLALSMQWWKRLVIYPLSKKLRDILLFSSTKAIMRSTTSVDTKEDIGFDWDRFWVTVAWTGTAVVNFVVMLILDSVYVYLLLNYNGSIVAMSQLMLSGVKVAWSDFCVFYIHEILLKYFNRCQSSEVVDVHATHVFSPHHQSRYSSRLSDRDTHFLSILAIINKIVIPCVAIAFVNSNCFYFTVVAPPPVTASVVTCPHLGTQKMCYNMLGSQRNSDVTYNPPFIYSFQCSSFFLSDYAPVFIFMCLWMALLNPALWFALQRWQHHLEAMGRVTSAAALSTQENHHQHDAQPEPKPSYRIHVRSMLHQLSHMFLPYNWKSYHYLYDSHLSSSTIIRSAPVINARQRHFIRVNNLLSVFLSFGVVFPPLACIVFVTLVVVMYFEVVNWVRMLHDAARHKNMKVFLAHADECAGILTQVADMSICRVQLWLSSLLFGFVLFDTLGDVTSASMGSIPFVLTALVVPIIMVFGEGLKNPISVAIMTNGPSTDGASHSENSCESPKVELMNVASSLSMQIAQK